MMAIQLEKSDELMTIYDMKDDEPDAQKEWSMKRRKLGVLMVAVGMLTAAFFIVPHMPGAAMLDKVFNSILAAIW
jgi:hypothetical protein